MADCDECGPSGSVPLEEFKRLAADFDNYRKRMEKSVSGAREEGKAALILDMLPVLDCMDAAEEHYACDKEMAGGISAVKEKLFRALSAHGLEEIPSSEGKRFDPRAEEAVKARGDAPEGVVARRLRKGYALKGRVIRHALVEVGAKKEAKEGRESKEGRTE